ncbi:cytochrome P450 [Pisolithus marmoratus]|nr:cytochrome P450 [Pisolithus marmoratus]
MFFLALGAACVAVVGLQVLATRAKSKLPYPPGPKGLPFIGSALNIDLQRPHLTYTQWAKTYGDIVYTLTLGQAVIIMNSEKTARMLADGRSEIYSDRYQSPLNRMYGTDGTTPSLEYGKEWKIHRKLFHLSLRNDVIDEYNDLHLSYARDLARNLLRDSSKLFEHIDLYSGAILVELIYGQQVAGKDDLTFAMANGLAEMMSREMTADKMGLLKVVPFLRYLPSWFPGAGFKRTASQCRKMTAEFLELPFAIAKQRMEHGALPHCLISDMLNHGGWRKPGAEKSAAALKTIVLIMILYPDVQDKVHAELDTVVGRGTLPTFADRQRLPYLQAVLYEVMRWNPPFPARAMNDHDYNDPELFDPTRHLTSDGQLSPEARQNNSIFFGFGKRIWWNGQSLSGALLCRPFTLGSNRYYAICF